MSYDVVNDIRHIVDDIDKPLYDIVNDMGMSMSPSCGR